MFIPEFRVTFPSGITFSWVVLRISKHRLENDTLSDDHIVWQRTATDKSRLFAIIRASNATRTAWQIAPELRNCFANFRWKFSACPSRASHSEHPISARLRVTGILTIPWARGWFQAGRVAEATVDAFSFVAFGGLKVSQTGFSRTAER